ncbi:MAG: AraC family transcriptional regulator [Burkholderiales bacterium PBB5]|nr:MAG: AraC family transcriptional regulator [Burkholderiales bacterium PBB5]
MADCVTLAIRTVRHAPPATIPIALVHTLLTGVRGRALPCTQFLESAGVMADLLSQPGARVTAAQYAALLRTVVEGLGDEFLLLGSRPVRPGGFALVTRMAAVAGTLEQAMRHAARTFALLQDDLVLEPVRDAALAGWALRVANPPPPHAKALQELVVRVLWRMLAWLAGGRLPPRRFDFAFAEPPHVGVYEHVFPAPLQFGQPLTAFWFDAARLQDRVRRDDAALREFLADAYALHMSTSSLQKRLALEGTSFQTLKDDLRRDLAIVRLSTGTVSLETLSRELGFSDSPTFQRAFKVWTGSAPGTYRRR